MKQSKRLWLRFFAAVSTVGWMVLIFMFSAQPATESSQISGRVSYRLVNGIDRMFALGQSEEEIERTAKKIDFPVRKCAHMSEYAVLSLLSLLLVFAYGKNMKEYSMQASEVCSGGGKWGRKYLCAFLVTAGYAVTDEIHQVFVPGRAGRFTDVLIDSAGALAALLCAGIIIKLKNRKR